MFRDTLWDTPELKQAALTWHRERDRQRAKEREGPWKREKKGLTESTWVGSVRRSGVQLLTPLHTQLQKNRTARSGLNWCTHVHLHWRDNWTDWPLKCLLKWPEPQRGNLTPSLLLSLSLPCVLHLVTLDPFKPHLAHIYRFMTGLGRLRSSCHLHTESSPYQTRTSMPFWLPYILRTFCSVCHQFVQILPLKCYVCISKHILLEI